MLLSDNHLLESNVLECKREFYLEYYIKKPKEIDGMGCNCLGGLFMMYSVYYGELSEARKEKWNNGEDNPYDILVKNKKISGYDWIKFLSIARQILKEEIQIDWGSFAWKGSKDDILKLKKEWRAKLEDEKFLKEDIEYGVVFIEEC